MQVLIEQTMDYWPSRTKPKREIESWKYPRLSRVGGPAIPTGHTRSLEAQAVLITRWRNVRSWGRSGRGQLANPAELGRK
jgi:hypothetical protein